MRSVATLQCFIEPYYLRFVPSYTSRVFVVSHVCILVFLFDSVNSCLSGNAYWWKLQKMNKASSLSWLIYILLMWIRTSLAYYCIAQIIRDALYTNHMVYNVVSLLHLMILVSYLDLLGVYIYFNTYLVLESSRNNFWESFFYLLHYYNTIKRKYSVDDSLCCWCFSCSAISTHPLV